MAPRDLPGLLAAMAPLRGAFSAVVTTSAPGPGHVDLTDMPEPVLRRLMALMRAGAPGGDDRLASAYLLGKLSWAVCEPLCGLALRGAWLVEAAPGAVRVAPRVVQREKDGVAGVSGTFDLCLDPLALRLAPYGPERPAEFAKALETLFTDPVERLFRLSGLSRAALWRMVGDSLAATFLAQARAMGDAEAGIAQARAILRDRGSKLFSKQTDFEWIALPEAPEIGDWLRLRGGCCRHYTLPDEAAQYCTSCVLRDAASRRDRFRAHLRQTRLAGAASA
ncbi:hypothetical protein SAMN04488567_2688 [Limimaricola pyoseonensis]|uniref:Ferric iron reductase protein FhuF, involved in iron transport n=1 Tax=Limimaricola pyoseonensis TaxID=521013 RepID=A0A1G7G2S0_9RHOB|nr:hypothetical protein SAMN04488567_2688 [Limimaricola pyoseonensis]